MHYYMLKRPFKALEDIDIGSDRFTAGITTDLIKAAILQYTVYMQLLSYLMIRAQMYKLL